MTDQFLNSLTIYPAFSLGSLMLQRSLLKRQLLKRKILLPSTLPLLLHGKYVVALLIAGLVLMPSAQAASCKIPKSYYKNVICTANKGYFLAVKDFGEPVALLNPQGKSVADLLRYQKVDADKISSGLLPVIRNGRVGYINMQGREVIPAMYDILKEGQGWARPVSEDRIVVKQNGHYGVIDITNKTVVPFSAAISNIENYRSGMAQLRKNKTTIFIDKNGKEKRESDTSANAKPSAKIDPSDNIALSAPKFEPIRGFTTLQPRQQDGKWGFVDDHNIAMITYSFDDVRPFSEGLAGVRIDSEWGFINLGGELVIPFRFDDSEMQASDSYKDQRYKNQPAFVFTEGKAWVGQMKDGAKMCINNQGSYVSCD